ncbi:bgl operon transcriptional regulator BglJ [Enterobacteriaceae bacterium RIT691]|nr:bgl operon transcriptional regulator BglJ [Enterobacteriaceae bacterium RIT691]
MEKCASAKHVAVIESCSLTEIGLKTLLSRPGGGDYQLHVFRDCEDWFAEQGSSRYDAVIYSVGENRLSRQACVRFLAQLSKVQPTAIRGLLAADEKQGRLIDHLSPVSLHGVLYKTTALAKLQAQIVALLKLCGLPQTSSVVPNAGDWRVDLSPTEKIILDYIGKGMSIAQIASQMARNAETIRTHKCNVMTKLGASSDTDLLYAADILRYLPFLPDSRV